MHTALQKRTRDSGAHFVIATARQAAHLAKEMAEDAARLLGRRETRGGRQLDRRYPGQLEVLRG